VYNETCAELNDRGDSWAICDALLAQGIGSPPTLPTTPTLDATTTRGLGAGALGKSEPESLLKALKAGQYYSSQGPRSRTCGSKTVASISNAHRTCGVRR
jgi:hypothetical protein